MRKEAIKGKGLAYDGTTSNHEKATELVRQYDWDATTIGQQEENEKIKDELRELGVTKISNSGGKSFGRLVVDIEKKNDDGFSGKNPADLW